MTKLSASQSTIGSGTPPLALAAAPPAIPTGLECSEQTVKVLIAILQGLFSETLSEDSMWLALRRAQETALKNEVTLEEFERVKAIIITDWQEKRRRNPLSLLFR